MILGKNLTQNHSLNEENEKENLKREK